MNVFWKVNFFLVKSNVFRTSSIPLYFNQRSINHTLAGSVQYPLPKTNLQENTVYIQLLHSQTSVHTTSTLNRLNGDSNNLTNPLTTHRIIIIMKKNLQILHTQINAKLRISNAYVFFMTEMARNRIIWDFIITSFTTLLHQYHLAYSSDIIPLTLFYDFKTVNTTSSSVHDLSYRKSTKTTIQKYK